MRVPMARRPPPKLTLGNMRHFAAAAIGITICLTLFLGERISEVEDAQIATRVAAHKAAKMVVSGNDQVGKKGGGMIIGMTTRSVPRSNGSWGSGGGEGGGAPAPSSGGGNAMPTPPLAPGDGQQREWEGGSNVLPPNHPAYLTREPEQSQAAGAPRTRKKKSEAPTAEQLNNIIEASRKRASIGGA